MPCSNNGFPCLFYVALGGVRLMGKKLTLFLLVLSIVALAACGAQNNGRSADQQTQAVERTRQSTEAGTAPMAENNPVKGQKIVSKAHSAIGTPYVFGGSEPGGFDCSGLVKWSYKSVGVTLPRTAREQSTIGEKIKKVEDMRAGDIVAFRHPKRGYHTGIYVGDGKFIHSPRKRTRVRVNSLSDPYFSSTLLGARRLDLASGQTVVAQAETKLEDLLASKSRLSVASQNINESKKRAASEKKHATVAEKSKKKQRKLVASKTTKKSTSKTVAKKEAKSASKSNKAKKSSVKTAAKTQKSKSNGKVASNSKTEQKNKKHGAVSMLGKKQKAHSGKRS